MDRDEKTGRHSMLDLVFADYIQVKLFFLSSLL